MNQEDKRKITEAIVKRLIARYDEALRVRDKLRMLNEKGMFERGADHKKDVKELELKIKYLEGEIKAYDDLCQVVQTMGGKK